MSQPDLWAALKAPPVLVSKGNVMIGYNPTEGALTVVGYHRVTRGPLTEVDSAPLGMFVTERTFESQLEFLKTRYRVLHLSELLDICEKGRALPPRACLITFDDGWRDNYTVAFPLLRKYGLPATVLVATDYVGTKKPFWYSRLLRMIRVGNLTRLSSDLLSGYAEPLRSELLRLRALGRPISVPDIDPLLNSMKALPLGVVDHLVSELGRHLTVDETALFPERLVLDWDEITEMAKVGVSFGSKTCSLQMLTVLSPQEARSELERSKQVLERRLGTAIDSLVFPHGAYTDQLVQMAWEVGYKLIFLSCPIATRWKEGRIFRCLCVHEGSSTGSGGRFSASLFSLNLSRMSELW